MLCLGGRGDVPCPPFEGLDVAGRCRARCFGSLEKYSCGVDDTVGRMTAVAVYGADAAVACLPVDDAGVWDCVVFISEVNFGSKRGRSAAVRPSGMCARPPARS